MKEFTRKMLANEPKMRAVDSRNTIRELVKAANEGWLLMQGGPDRVQPIEKSVYTPGTPKNAGFEIIIIYKPYMNHVWLAKKCDELDRYLQNQFDLAQGDVKVWQVLLFDPPAIYPVPPGTHFQTPDGKVVAVAGAKALDLEIFLNAYLRQTRY